MILPFSSIAQTNEAAVRQKINVNIPTNSAKSITASKVRETFNSIMDYAGKMTPSLTQKQVRDGYADAAPVVQIINPINKQAFTFYYDSGSSESDDSATVIKSGSRVYKIRTDFITPEIFGAVGDGVVNDSLAFAKAMRYLHNKVGSGTLTIPAKTYLRADMTITKPNIHVVGQGTLKNSTIYVHGAVPTTTMNFRIQGITFERSTMVPGESLTANNGIEVYNASKGLIIDCIFKKVNAGIYVPPTGVFQHVQRLDIVSCRFDVVNYGVKVADVPDAIGGVPVASRLGVGDLTFANSTVIDAYYDHFYGYGLDGFTATGLTLFARWNGDLSTKRHNFNIKVSTRLVISETKFFEAGDDAIRLTDCDKVNISNSQIAWPGQRVCASGIHIIRTRPYPEITVSIVVNNVLIETPTLHGIHIEGSVDTRMFTFTDMHLQNLGASFKFYGGTYGNPAPNTFAHYSIKSDASADNVTYIGKTDAIFTDYIPLIEGRAGFWQEENTYFNTINRGYGSGISFGFGEQHDTPSIRENLLPRSNGLTTSSAYTASNASITAINNAYSPFGVGTIYKLAETAATGSLEHVLFSAPITKDSVGDIAYTLTFYAKAAERRYISVYLVNGSFNPGIPIDFDLLKGVPASSGEKVLIGAGYKILNSSIKRANNGFWKISISYISPAAHVTARFAIYLKTLIQNQGPRSYVGTEGSGVYLSDFQFSRTAVELPYTPTSGAAFLRAFDYPTPFETKSASITYDPPSIAAGAITTTTITVTGATLGQTVRSAFSLDLTNDITVSSRVSAANTITVTFRNIGASPVDLGSGTLSVKVD